MHDGGTERLLRGMGMRVKKEGRMGGEKTWEEIRVG